MGMEERKMGNRVSPEEMEAQGRFIEKIKEIIDEFKLEVIYMPRDPQEILIDENDVNRPGLQLTGYFDHFGN